MRCNKWRRSRLVLLLLGATLWVLRRRGLAGVSLARTGSAARRMECLERLPLGPQHTLHLVRVGETRTAGGVLALRLLAGAELCRARDSEAAQ